MADNRIPNDLIPESQVPSDLRPGTLYDRATTDFPQWLRDLPHNFSTRPMQPYAPSATTAATMVIPGAGLIPALARIGTSGVGHGAESALAGNDAETAVKAGLKGAAWQTAGEGTAAMVAPALTAAKKYGGPLFNYLSTFMPGANARTQRAIYYASRSMPRGGAAEAIPGEAMGLYKPTGIPASTILGPTGAPARAAIPPEVVPHPSLQGWTMADTLHQAPKAVGAAAPPPGGLLRMLIRLGTGAKQNDLSNENEQPQ